MKPIKSKRQERQEIAHQIEHYLKGGGHVESVAPGISGREPGNYFAPPISFQPQQDTRTPVIDAIRAIDGRRKSKPRPPAAQKRREPRRVLIKDDFGEPLRWEWRD